MSDVAKKPLVLLSRAINFSSGFSLRNPNWDESTNRDVFGQATGPHGAEFCWRVFLRGPISVQDGMIVNIAEIKPQLRSMTERLEGKFLNYDLEFFRQNRPTVENIALYLLSNFPSSIGSGQLHRLELDRSAGGRVEIEVGLDSSQHVMKVSHAYEFAAAHRLFAPELSEQENWQRFDKCSNRAGHGHNFQLRVWIEGQPHPDSGFIINPRLLDEIVDDEVYQRFDHKHLNEDCPEFTGTGLVPTSENLAKVIFDLLKRRLQVEGYHLVRVGLQETQKNYFEVEA